MNQRRAVIWVSLGAPLLILLALLATNQRQGKDRVQVLPAILVGSGLIISSALGRQRRRARLLADLQRARTPGRQQPMNETDPQRPDLEEVRQAIASGDPVQAMPAITKLRHCSDAEAVPLLVLGTEQKPFLVRSLSCSGLGYKRTEQGWTVLSALITADEDPNVRAEAANALASYGVDRAWPLLRSAFEADAAWLVRCSILSALAEQPAIDLGWLLELATMAIADADAIVRVSGAEILSRIVREGRADLSAVQARGLLQSLQQDSDHRVVAAVLNGLQVS